MDSVECPRRGNKLVTLEICVGVCEFADQCEEIKNVPKADLDEALFRFNGIPPTTELVTVGDTTVEIEGREEEERKERKHDPERAATLLRKAMELKNQIEEKFWDMGEVLHEIFTKQFYIDSGYVDWKQFCDECLDIKWRTATYLKDIFGKFSVLGVKPEERQGIGWAKLKELLPIINKENVRFWLEVAKEKKNSIPILNNKVKLALGKITEEEAAKIPQALVFRLYEEQMENVERALELARRLTGSESRSYQLEMMCAEFRATYESVDEKTSKAEIVATLVRKIESIMGVQFTGDVIDAGTGEIILERRQS